ncbi:MAG: BMP family ABC transporter substrate-binding protein [Anaerolineales bacterium]|nr:BMP family ABC transporter substrate-binding protein [Anaerolineales bacterium]
MRYAKPILFGAILVLALVSGCGGPPPPTPQRVLNVGMILGSGGLGDRSFNDSAYAGLQEAQRQFGIRFETINHTSAEANLEQLRRLIRQGYDLIIGIGFENANYIGTLAQESPDRKFAVVDVVAEGDNVASIVYREQEGDFLMGVLAAMLTESKRVGFIGGMDIDIIRRIESGFKQGVAYQDSSVEVVSDLAGTFADPEVGKSLALAQYEAGVDVIYNGAGRTGLGIIEAAKEAGKLTIGTSGDQRYLAPGNVVGNRPKRVDTAVLMLVEELHNGQFTAGTRSLGLREKGLSLGPFDENLVSDVVLERLEDLKQQIIAGEIVVEVPGE